MIASGAMLLVLGLLLEALILVGLGMHERFLWPSLLYVPAIILAVLDVRLRAPRGLLDAPATPERS